jgi:hypothetical protein
VSPLGYRAFKAAIGYASLATFMAMAVNVGVTI